MSPERYRQVKAILQAALELDPNKQAAFLEGACADDPELKQEVQSLLDHDMQSKDFLEKPAVAGEAASHLRPGTRIRPYEMVGPSGAGGMGEVYRRRDPPFGAETAAKFLPAAFPDDTARPDAIGGAAHRTAPLPH